MKRQLLCAFIGTALLAEPPLWSAEGPSVTVGTFPQEIRTEFGEKEGLPSAQVFAVAVAGDGTVYAGTAKGLARFSNGRWSVVPGVTGDSVEALAVGAGKLFFTSEQKLQTLEGQNARAVAPLPARIKVYNIAAGEHVYVATDQGLFEAVGDALRPVTALNNSLGGNKAVYQIATGPRLAVGAASGLFVQTARDTWTRLLPSDKSGRSWAPVEVRGVAYDSQQRLWFASPQGAGRLGEDWVLFTGADGLPYNDFTTMVPGEEGVVWFGTRKGAIRYDGKHWAYRQGRRWLPEDVVNSMAVTREGHAWLATSAGLSRIERRPMTLAEKALHYEKQIDALHRRTPWEYVLEVSLAKPGDTTQFTQHDSDNDGLWTSMYGAGECFAYGATKSPVAKKRAVKAFEALRWLGEATQGGSHPAPRGYVARTILPTGGHNPNTGRLEQDRRERDAGDSLWKVYEPRWPTSADGKWYWKSDTSSDELDGHYFFYALYYDLVCETEAEKARVRDHVRAMTEHFLEHNFQLVDHDGKPTRWGVFNPESLNYDPRWIQERGLNSLSMLSYLATAAHMTGDARFQQAAEMLRTKHAYGANLMVPKMQRGIGSGNHSDDEMAFMSFYNLMNYEKDPKFREQVASSFYGYWTLEQPEMNPFFNFAYAAFGFEARQAGRRGARSLAPWPGWLEDSVETLQRFPLDRFNWRHSNSHRLDLVPLSRQASFEGQARFARPGYRVNGKAIPVDERFFNHWNHNPFALDTGGDGRELADGAVFLMPYYMGLYHGFIKDEGVERLQAR